MMTLEAAGTLVLADARQNRTASGLPDAEVLDDVRSRISLDDLVDYEDDLTEAYRVFLAHHQNPTRDQLCSMIMALTAGPPENMPVHYRVWHRRIVAGELL